MGKLMELCFRTPISLPAQLALSFFFLGGSLFAMITDGSFLWFLTSEPLIQIDSVEKTKFGLY